MRKPPDSAREGDGSRESEELRAPTEGGPRESAPVVEGMESPRAPIEAGGEILVGAEKLGGGRAIDELHRCSARLPLFDSPLHGLERRGRMHRLEPSVSHRVAGNRVLFDESEDALCGAPDEIHQPFSRLGPEQGNELVGVLFETGNHLPAVETRGGARGLTRIQQDDFGPSRGQVKRRGESGVAAAYYRDVGPA